MSLITSEENRAMESGTRRRNMKCRARSAELANQEVLTGETEAAGLDAAGCAMLDTREVPAKLGVQTRAYGSRQPAMRLRDRHGL